MENCIFCKIISGEIPSSKVYEDDKVLAFLDISQTTKGHTLVIPKEHVRNVLAMSEETSQELFARLPKIARAVQKATGAVGMNIVNNNEEVAGQTVFHAHVHLIPRYGSDDEFSLNFTEHEPDFEALGKLAEQIAGEVENEISTSCRIGVASCAGFAAYQAYQKREEYTQEITDVNDISNRIVDDISKISRSIEDINQQLPKLKVSVKI